jgi:hypothetical protein
MNVSDEINLLKFRRFKVREIVRLVTDFLNLERGKTSGGVVAGESGIRAA